MFDHLYGNHDIKLQLSSLLEKGRLTQTFLFAGPSGVGKTLFADTVAKILLGSSQHPDLHHYRSEGKTGMHSIDSIRQFSEEVYLAPYQGNRKVFVIHDADRMLPTASNALLKTLEEPSEDSTIILLSKSPARLLPTILSRCRILNFHHLSEDEIALALKLQWKQSDETAQVIAKRSKGSLEEAVRLIHSLNDPIIQPILNLLETSKPWGYRLCCDVAQAAELRIEEAKKVAEEELESNAKGKEEWSLVLQERWKKESEAKLAELQYSLAQRIFDAILGWYRDMQLILVGGDRGLLMHPNYEESIEQALQRGEFRPIEDVIEVIKDARLSIERSTSLLLCFENLFLKLTSTDSKYSKQ